MRFKKIVDDVELPEKASRDLYINVRSAERIDVRGNECIEVRTGVEILVSAKEVARLSGPNVVTTSLKTGNKYMELRVPIRNTGPRNIMIYPGQVIALIEIERATAGKKVRTTTLKSQANFTPAASDGPGLHRKKDCAGCG